MLPGRVPATSCLTCPGYNHLSGTDAELGESGTSTLTFAMVRNEGFLFWFVALAVLTVSHVTDGQRILRKTYLTNHPEAICNDGSPGMFYYSLAPERDVDRWVIYFEGGVFCTNNDTCKDRDVHYTTSRNDIYPGSMVGTDLFSMGEFSPFESYNHVYVPYCTSDMYLAERMEPLFYRESGEAFYVRGGFVVRAIFEEVENLGLTDDSQLVLAGSSAGALGMINYAIHYKEMGRYPNMAVVFDSGWFLDHYSFLSEETKDLQYRKDIKIRACSIPSPGVTRLPCCFMMSCLFTTILPNLDIDIFAVVSSTDMFAFGALAEDPENYPQFDFTNPANSANLQLDYYTGSVNTSFAISINRRTSVFQVSCGQHVFFRNVPLWNATGPLGFGDTITFDNGAVIVTYKYATEPGYWHGVKVKDVTLGDALNRWVESNFSLQRTWDDCQDFLCNPTCPDKIIVELKGVRIPRTAELIFLVIGVVALTMPTLVKVYLMVRALLVRRGTVYISKLLEEDDLSYQPEEYFQRRRQSCISIQTTRSLNSTSLLKLIKGEELLLACKDITVTVQLPKEKKQSQDEIIRSVEANARRGITDTWDGLPGQKAILRGVTVEMKPKELVGIMGPSGSGKTTFLHILANRTQGYDVQVGEA